MRLASELAGFSMGEADELRRAMGKKDAAKMQAQRDRFLDGCRARGIPDKKATKIFEYMEYFAGYGFPKAHSTTYASSTTKGAVFTDSAASSRSRARPITVPDGEFGFGRNKSRASGLTKSSERSQD